MTAARARRVERLEDASVLRLARGVAADYGLTEEETAEVERDTKRALVRWRAGLPIGLEWILDEPAREYGLSAEEQSSLEADVRGMLADRAVDR